MKGETKLCFRGRNLTDKAKCEDFRQFHTRKCSFLTVKMSGKSTEHKHTHTGIIYTLPTMEFGADISRREMCGVVCEEYKSSNGRVKCRCVSSRIHHHVAAWIPVLISPYPSSQLGRRKCVSGGANVPANMQMTVILFLLCLRTFFFHQHCI